MTGTFKRIGLFIFLYFLAAVSAYPYGFNAIQDPKAYVTHLRFNYNFSYQKTEIEAKAARSIDLFKMDWFSAGFMGGITIFIHPTDQFWGAYPVDNLIGAFGLYAGFDNFGIPGFSVLVYPIVHESTHLVDGYDGGSGNIYNDRVYDSNEYFGFDVRYTLGNLKLYAGFIGFIYLFKKTIDTMARPLLCRLHIGEEWTMPIIADKMNLMIASDVGLYYENGFKPALNAAIGLDLITHKVMLHYEYQNGLGQDFRVIQQRLGLEWSIL